MSGKSKIEWTNATWNPITGCSIVSKGCQNCYAMRLAHRLSHVGGKTQAKYAGLTEVVNGNPVWNGVMRLADEATLTVPLRWRKPRRIFVCSMSDLFHEDAPDEWIDKIFAVMALCPQHSFQVLTKRPERMRAYLAGDTERRSAKASIDFMALSGGAGRHHKHIQADATEGWATWPLPNLWAGTSVEDQKRADERIPWILKTPAAVRGLSCEPLLGPIDLTNILAGRWPGDPPGPAEASYVDSLRGERWYLRQGRRLGPDRVNRIDWVIVGGESGPGGRPMHPDWARSIRDQCQAAGVPFFFKQWGEWGPVVSTGDDPDPEGRSVMALPDGTLTDTEWNGGPGSHLIDAQPMFRTGKKAAGRKLDDRTWDEYPDG